MSPSSRRAWIEILHLGVLAFHLVQVALLAEGVDRNFLAVSLKLDQIPVALLAEGVDRNAVVVGCNQASSESPSSRRAWIEILIAGP